MSNEYVTKMKQETTNNIITVHTHKVMCAGSKAPLDHPHVYLPLIDSNETICPYCSKKYIYVAN